LDWKKTHLKRHAFHDAFGFISKTRSAQIDPSRAGIFPLLKSATHFDDWARFPKQNVLD
jgi:hypothetical protein